jgi:2-oxoglutarate ferredoxin oxidoreductase subunit beta
MTGNPFHLPEMISGTRGFHPAYVARGAVYDAKRIQQTKKMIKNAFEAQINGEGFSLVEILSACPTNWHKTPLQCKEHIGSVVVNEYPLGEYKSRGQGENKA